MEDMSWEDVRMFLAVAEEGSFSDAARRLRVGQPTVSRRIAALEERLECALFHRGRRGTTLTKRGDALVQPARQMARWARELMLQTEEEDTDIQGTVTIATPPGIAASWLTPFTLKLREQYPDLRLSLRASIEYLDLASGEADLAIRTTPSSEPALVTLASLASPLGVFASREYAAKLQGTPHLEDLDWICWSEPYLHLSPRPELEAWIPGFVPALETDDCLVQLKACELGIGVMILPVMEHSLVTPPGLVELDVDFPELRDLRAYSYLVCARSIRNVPRVRAVIDAFVEAFDALQPSSES